MYSTKETQTEQHGSEEFVQTSLMRISTKADKLKKYRFRNLYMLLSNIFLLVAWKKINKKSAAGVDEVTANEFKKNLKDNINKIVENLKRKRYRAKLVRRVYIDKGNGKKRPLGIPVLVDKLVQRAVAMILESIYEKDFIEDSYGYRPKRSAKMAINKVRRKLQLMINSLSG